jgi:hypothetical protein
MFLSVIGSCFRIAVFLERANNRDISKSLATRQTTKGELASARVGLATLEPEVPQRLIDRLRVKLAPGASHIHSPLATR